MSEPMLNPFGYVWAGVSDHHDEVEAYRTRAEQEAAELRKLASNMARALKEARKFLGNRPDADDRGWPLNKVKAGLDAYAAHMIRYDGEQA